MSLLLKFVHLKLNVEKNVEKKHLPRSRKRFEIEKSGTSRYKGRRCGDWDSLKLDFLTGKDHHHDHLPFHFPEFHFTDWTSYENVHSGA